jgi:hypothetical protein
MKKKLQNPMSSFRIHKRKFTTWLDRHFFIGSAPKKKMKKETSSKPQSSFENSCLP